MKVSFGSIRLEYNSNFDKNGFVFDEIKKEFPKGTKIETQNMKDFNGDICWTNHRIEGKTPKDEENIAIALIKSRFHFSIINETDGFSPTKRIQRVKTFFKNLLNNE